MNLLTILGCIFITLKLVDVIEWSWWVVLLPLYGGLTVALVIYLVGFLCVLWSVK